MENEELHNILAKQRYSFKPYFSDRVMKGIESVPEVVEDSFNQALDYLFPRISMASMSVLSIVILLVMINTGSFDIDMLLGLSDYEENIHLQSTNSIFSI